MSLEDLIRRPKFAPLEMVRLSLFKLNYTARVDHCRWNGSEWSYFITYACEGIIKDGLYREDEITAAVTRA